MLALCLMLLGTYYTQNYAGIIGRSLLGDLVQFFCIQDRSLPLSEIVWLKDDMLLPVSSSDRYLVQSEELLHVDGKVSSSLLISSVRSSDAGLFGCRAVNPLLPNNPVYSNNATLTVTGNISQ